MAIKDSLAAARDRVIEVLGAIPASHLQEATHRAYEVGYFDGNDEPPQGELASFGYRRTTASGLRDFTKVPRDRLIEIVWTLYQSNPVAKRYLQIKRDYILGRGVAVQADDPKLKEVIDEFVSDNQFDRRLSKWVLQLYLWGEQCLPAFVRPSDGKVMLGYIDPAQIEMVVAHPQNSMEAWAVVIKPGLNEQVKKVFRIVRRDLGFATGNRVISPNHSRMMVTPEQARLEPWESQFLGQQGLTAYTGAAFYFPANNVSNQPRGFSDLLQVADFLDSHDEVLFSLADREQFAGFFSWDVTVIGADDNRIKERAKQVRSQPPKRGSVNFHNDSEVWNFNYPDLKTSATVATADALETHALGGLGIPRHWYAHGDGTNRATAMAQGDPTYKTMQAEQDFVSEMIREIFCFVRDQAKIAGYWRGSEDELTIVMPEMSKRDVSSYAGSLQQVVTALSVAMMDLKVITKERAAETVAKVLAELGIEYDAIEELEAAEKEAESRADNAPQQSPPDEQEQATAEKANEWLVNRLSEVNGR